MRKKQVKRGVAFALGLMMAVHTPVGTLAPAMVSFAYTERAAVVSATTLNVRSGPGTTYSIVTKLSSGAGVTVIGEKTASDGATWYEIRFTGSGGAVTTGYASNAYIKFPTAYSTDSDFEAYMTNQGFPESYKAGLRQLHSEYPNWEFKAQKTNLDWETVIQNESVVGRNLVAKSNISSWKSIADGAYDWDSCTWPGFDGSTWVAASEDIIRYYMDPRNFLDSNYVFQFLLQSFDSADHNAAGLESIVKGTFMESKATGAASGETSGTAVGPGAVSGSTTTAGGATVGSSTAGTTAGTTTGSSTSVQVGVAPGGGTSGGSTSSAPAANSTGTTTAPVTNTTGGTTTGTTTTTAGSTSSGSTSVVTGVAPGSSGSTVTQGTSAATTTTTTTTGTSNVSLESPHASISRKDGNLLATSSYGPGMGLSSGGSTSSGSSSGSAPSSGNLSYVDILLNAGSASGVNPYVLAAMIIQEQGVNGTSGLISGTTAGYAGYYNFFNIDAFQAENMTAVQRGLWYASQSGSYQRPWNTVEKAIMGGATYYGENYVKVGQDTFYLKKFNVQGSNLYKHQYMTNVQGAASEGAKLAQAYTEELKKTSLDFKIPVYNNMPASPAVKPTLDGSPNNKLSGLSVAGFILTPTFNKNTAGYDLIVDTSVNSITIAASVLDSTASVSGAGEIQLPNVSNDIVVVVKAQNGTTREYTIHVVKQTGGPTYSANLSNPGGTGSSDSQSGPGVSAVGPGGSSSVSVSPIG